MRPQELLNRWMTALDQRIEYLSLPGGRKFEIPFDTLVIFSTNIDPRQLGENAFLCRIPNKINVYFAAPEQFVKIFRRESEEVRGLPVDEEVLDFLVYHLQNEIKVPLSQGYARDLLDQIFWAARYLNAKPEFNKDLAKWACSNYFFSGIKSSNSAAKEEFLFLAILNSASAKRPTGVPAKANAPSSVDRIQPIHANLRSRFGWRR